MNPEAKAKREKARQEIREKQIADALQLMAEKYAVAKGEKGDTPVFGVDFLRENELAEIMRSITPKYGTDYMTPEDVTRIREQVTPRKGKDYFDGKKGDKGDQGYDGKALTWDMLTTEQKDSLRGNTGPMGAMPKHQWDGTSLRFEKAPGVWGEFVNLQGENGTPGEHAHGYGEFEARRSGGATRFIELADVSGEFTLADALKVVRVNATGTALEYATGGGGAVDSVNGDTGAVIVDLQSATDQGSTATNSISLLSDNSGGENTFDSTKRINLNSYQRAEDTNNFGEVMRIYSDQARSKQMIAWYKRFNIGTTTFTDAGDIWNATDHFLEDTDRVVLSTTGTLPTGYSAGTTTDKGVTTGTVYYVISSTATTFQLSATKGGSAVVGTGTGSGTITYTIVPKLKAWIGWHYRPNDVSDTLDPHDHISIETNDSQGLIRTRFEVLAANLDTTQVNTFNSNFTVIQGVNGVTGTDGNTKSFAIYTSTTNRDKTIRWGLQGNATAESGSNVGTDFQIARFNDAGSFIDSPFCIKRSTGDVGIGASVTSPLARLDVRRTTDANVLLLKNTAASNNAALALLQTETSASRVIQAGISTDTTQRFSMEASGKMEWGAGGASARDTNLYRSAANVLKTDDSLEVADEAYDVSWNGSLQVPTKNAVYDKVELIQTQLNNVKADPIGFSATNPVTGHQGTYSISPAAGTITGFAIMVDAGTATVKVWKVASGTATPTAANSINTSGVSISTGTAIISSTVTDFTTIAVAADDMFAFEITAVSGVTKIAFILEITKT